MNPNFWTDPDISFEEKQKHAEKRFQDLDRLVEHSQDNFDPQNILLYHELALICHFWGEYKEAFKYSLRAVEINDRFSRYSGNAKFNEDHALICDSAGYFDEALEYNLKASNITKYEEGFSSRYNSKKDLASHQEAFESRQKDQEIKPEQLDDSEDNAADVESERRLGLDYIQKGDLKRALRAYSTALETSKNVYGEMHLEVSNSYDMLASVYSSLGKQQEAFTNLEKAIKIRESVIQDDDPNIANLYSHLADLSEKMENNERAIECYLKVVKIRESILGENHYEIAVLFNQLATVYRKLKQFQKALEYRKKALQIMKTGNKVSLSSETLTENQNSKKFQMQPILVDKHYQNNFS